MTSPGLRQLSGGRGCGAAIRATVGLRLERRRGKSITGEMPGTDSAHMKTREMLCQQYVLETERVIYTIRPKDDKHPVLLPIGEKAQFRMDKDKIVLRVEDLDDKERE
jgi:hypothetical protein